MKTVSMELSEYNIDLRNEYFKGYRNSFMDLCKFMLATDTQNADIYFEIIRDYTKENELYDFETDLINWFDSE